MDWPENVSFPPNNQVFYRSTTTTRSTQEQKEGKVDRKREGEEEGDAGSSQPELKEMGHWDSLWRGGADLPVPRHRRGPKHSVLGRLSTSDVTRLFVPSLCVNNLRTHAQSAFLATIGRKLAESANVPSLGIEPR